MTDLCSKLSAHRVGVGGVSVGVGGGGVGVGGGGGGW